MSYQEFLSSGKPEFSFLNTRSKGLLNQKSLESSIMGFKDRLLARRNELGYNSKELAKRVGVSPGTMSMWVNGTTEPRGANLLSLASVLRCSPEWLKFGSSQDGDSAGNGLGFDSSPLGSSSPVKFANVPFYNVELSAGHGRNGDDHIEIEYHQIPESDLDALGMTVGQAAVCRVRGDSMETTLQDGDLVLINTAIKRPVSDKIFAFAFDDDLKIKRFIRRLDNTWRVSSDNKDDPSYQDETISPQNIGSLNIIGQVVSLVRRQLL